MTGVIEIFMEYDPDVVLKAISPVWGIPGRFKFLPALSEIKEVLDEIMAPVWRERERQARISPPEPRVNDVPQPSGKKQYSYAEFMKMVEEGKVKPRPIGRFEKPDDKWNRIMDLDSAASFGNKLQENEP